MPDRIEGAIVRLLRLGQTLSLSREVVNFGEITDRGENYGRELRRAIGQILLAVACAWFCLFVMRRM